MADTDDEPSSVEVSSADDPAGPDVSAPRHTAPASGPSPSDAQPVAAAASVPAAKPPADAALHEQKPRERRAPTAPIADTTSVLAAAIESLTLRDAAARSGLLPNDVRLKLRSDLALATQRRNAAEVLARHGHPAEAFALARESFGNARRVAQKLLAAQAPGVSFPRALGLTPAGVLAVERASRATERLAPERDDAFGPEDELALSIVLENAPKIERRLDRLTASSRELWLLRVRRLVVVALAFAAALAALVWVAAPRKEVTATASAWWGSSEDEHPRNAVDGDESTEWHLPDAALGFLEIRATPARDLRAVRLLDTRNPPFYDRITTRVRLTAFAGDRQLVSRESELPASIGAGRWVEVPLVASSVDRIRIDVLAFRQKGGGLTEVVLVDR